MKYDIEIYRNGTVDSLPGPNIFHLSQLNKFYQLYTYIFVLKGDGKTMLIDTGCGDVEEINESQGEDRNNIFNIPENETITAILDSAGIDPKEVTHVFLTHLHHDHCSNIEMFSNAKVVVSKKGLSEYLKGGRPYYYNRFAYPPDAINHISSLPTEKVVFVEDELEVMDGIRAFWVGGHSPCCMAIEVESNRGKAVFTTDIAFLIDNIEKDHPIGLYYNLWEVHEGYKKIKERADIILTSHDPVIIDKLFTEKKI